MSVFLDLKELKAQASVFPEPVRSLILSEDDSLSVDDFLSKFATSERLLKMSEEVFLMDDIVFDPDNLSQTVNQFRKLRKVIIDLDVDPLRSDSFLNSFEEFDMLIPPFLFFDPFFLKFFVLHDSRLKFIRCQVIQ